MLLTLHGSVEDGSSRPPGRYDKGYESSSSAGDGGGSPIGRVVASRLVRRSREGHPLRHHLHLAPRRVRAAQAPSSPPLPLSPTAAGSLRWIWAPKPSPSSVRSSVGSLGFIAATAASAVRRVGVAGSPLIRFPTPSRACSPRPPQRRRVRQKAYTSVAAAAPDAYLRELRQLTHQPVSTAAARRRRRRSASSSPAGGGARVAEVADGGRRRSSAARARRDTSSRSASAVDAGPPSRRGDERARSSASRRCGWCAAATWSRRRRPRRQTASASTRWSRGSLAATPAPPLGAGRQALTFAAALALSSRGSGTLRRGAAHRSERALSAVADVAAEELRTACGAPVDPGVIFDRRPPTSADRRRRLRPLRHPAYTLRRRRRLRAPSSPPPAPTPPLHQRSPRAARRHLSHRRVARRFLRRELLPRRVGSSSTPPPRAPGGRRVGRRRQRARRRDGARGRPAGRRATPSASSPPPTTRAQRRAGSVVAAAAKTRRRRQQGAAEEVRGGLAAIRASSAARLKITAWISPRAHRARRGRTT